VPATPSSNLFTPEQAEILGDLFSQQMANRFKVLRRDKLTSHVQDIADRLTATVDPKLHVHIAIVDERVANAFTFPGGRIFLTRKLIGLMRSEDELAAVIGHEIGHVVGRDGERTLSYYFRQVLGVTAINSDSEVTEDFHRFLENTRRTIIPPPPGKSEQQQLSADRVAVWVMTRAGYDPQAFSDFWDRFSETQGKAGSWISDLFGATKPEQKRLRQTVRETASLPAGCIVRRADTGEAFKSWQSEVLLAVSARRSESLHSVTARYKLDPPLRPDLEYLRFSPDGKWILAQDETAIYILSRDPLALRFQAPAADAYHAVFSPDSAAVSFYDENLRVQRWDIASGKREFLHDVSLGPMESCPDSLLSPDGRSLACIDADHNLRIIDVATAARLFEKKQATPQDQRLTPVFIVTYHGIHQGTFHKAFSPDGRYFVAAHGGYAVAVDVANRKMVSLGSSLQQHLSDGFAFQGADKMVVLDRDHPEHSAIRRFPSGDVVTELPLGKQSVGAPTHGDEFVFLRPIVKYPIGVMDVKSRKIVSGNRVAAFDMYDHLCVSEGRVGEVVLFPVESSAAVAALELPPARLGHIRVAALSPDFKRLAISGRARGAVWDLEQDQRLTLMRGYGGAFFDSDGALYIDVLPQGQTQRQIVRVDPQMKSTQPIFMVDNPQSPKELEEKLHAATGAAVTTLIGYTHQHGQFVIVEAPGSAKQEEWGRNVELTVYDVRSGKKAWSRHFPKERPSVSATSYNGTMTLVWNASESYGKQTLAENPDLKRELAEMRTDQGGVALVEVLELASGKVLGHVLIDTGSGSFVPRSISSTGDYVYFTDNQNRIVLYALSSGKQLGRVFGDYAAVTAQGKLFAVRNGAGDVTLYALPSMEKRDVLTFAGKVVFQRFAPEGDSLLVITDDHMAYQVDVSEAAIASATAEPSD